MSDLVPGRYATHRVLLLQSLIDLLPVKNTSIREILRPPPLRYGLVPESGNSRTAIRIAKRLVGKINARIDKTDQDSLSIQIISWLSAEPQHAALL